MLARVAHEHPNAGVLGPPHPDPEALATALAAYERHRKRVAEPIPWQVTNEKARIKLHRLYPSNLS